jgi:hypothetical protein
MNIYKIEIADKTGHTTVADLTLDQAVDNILEHAENNARWVFINGEKFEFQGANYRAQENIQKLRGKLEVMEDPAVLLTGILIGGLNIRFHRILNRTFCFTN